MSEHEKGYARNFTEEFKVSGEAVLSKVKELVREGNVRRIIIKNEGGSTLIEVPLTIGVIGTVLLPVWAAIGAIAALVANLTIAVERRGAPEAPAATRAGADEGPGGHAGADTSGTPQLPG
ncbi:MAG TPA: DUF4342 domain-containing protein [Trueperaceae bacterium]|nr:DUF4342 domain-containing protein [Trueperaceae bacterium]